MTLYVFYMNIQGNAYHSIIDIENMDENIAYFLGLNNKY